MREGKSGGSVSAHGEVACHRWSGGTSCGALTACRRGPFSLLERMQRAVPSRQPRLSAHSVIRSLADSAGCSACDASPRRSGGQLSSVKLQSVSSVAMPGAHVEGWRGRRDATACTLEVGSPLFRPETRSVSAVSLSGLLPVEQVSAPADRFSQCTSQVRHEICLEGDSVAASDAPRDSASSSRQRADCLAGLLGGFAEAQTQGVPEAQSEEIEMRI